jgi:hypothetical protein
MSTTAFGIVDNRISKADDKLRAAARTNLRKPSAFAAGAIGATIGSGARSLRKVPKPKSKPKVTPYPLSPLRIVQAHEAERLRALEWQRNRVVGRIKGQS